MILKDALPERKVRIELHLLDPEGRTLDILESDNRNIDWLMQWGSLEYDYMIPLTKRYIFYVRKNKKTYPICKKGAENDDR